MFYAVKSLYKNVQCNVRVNDRYTSWFDVKCGLKQGCLLSPLLFNLYINDRLTTINNLSVGVVMDSFTVGILAYADDVVLLAETENDLNLLLDCLNTWTQANDKHDYVRRSACGSGWLL